MDIDIKQLMSDLEQQVTDGHITRDEASRIAVRLLDDFASLPETVQAAVKRCIAFVRETPGRHSEYLPDQSEAYAYPHVDGVAYGWNSHEGENKNRGIWLKERPL